MFDQKLFLAVPQTKELKSYLQKANVHLLSLFQLVEIELKDQSFLGKEVALLSQLEQLLNLEQHLFSVIKRVAPQYTPKTSYLITDTTDPKGLRSST